MTCEGGLHPRGQAGQEDSLCPPQRCPGRGDPTGKAGQCHVSPPMAPQLTPETSLGCSAHAQDEPARAPLRQQPAGWALTRGHRSPAPPAVPAAPPPSPVPCHWLRNEMSICCWKITPGPSRQAPRLRKSQARSGARGHCPFSQSPPLQGPGLPSKFSLVRAASPAPAHWPVI